MKGRNSVISASSSHQDRFITVTGGHTIEFYDVTFKHFGTYTLLGGVMYYNESKSVSIVNCNFHNNTAEFGGAIYL